MFNSSIINKVEIYVRKLFALKLSEDVHYHNIKHTLEVVDVVQEIGAVEHISDEENEILIIAGWFHDTGHFHCCDGHEEQSVNYADKYLSSIFYPPEKIKIILNCIRSTKIPQHPNNKLEEIICDADLHHLGEPDIRERGDALRKELELRGIKKLTDIEWMKHSLAFFDQHHFFTDYAKNKYGLQKEKNMIVMREYLNSLIEVH